MEKTAFLFLVPLLLLLGRGVPDAAGQGDDESATEFLFFAVLEGLYAEGVQPEVAARVLAEPGAGDGVRAEVGYFVPGCPVCMPVRDAFRVYAAAPDILLWKKCRAGKPGGAKGFGPGLGQEELDALSSWDRQVQVRALEKLVERYSRRRMEQLALSEDEKARLEQELLDGRKLGMSVLLAARGDPEQQWAQEFGQRCPSCEGATSGAQPSTASDSTD